jgi:glucokinase
VDGEMTVKSLGLDLGATDVKLAVLDGEQVVATGTAPTRSEEGPDAVLARLVEFGLGAGPADAVGVAVPGQVDRDGNALFLPNLHGSWTGVPIVEPLADGFGVPVAVLNDGHAFALAETRIGAARGAQDVVCVVCGTGVGGGLVLGGRLRLGMDDRGGEIGHMTVAADGPLCGCGNQGCVEAIAGARAIAQAAGKESFAAVLAAAQSGETAALAALERAGRHLGIAVANLAVVLTPERVVIGGGVAEAGELLLGPLRDEVVRRAGAVVPVERIEIVRAALGPFAGAIGAALHGADEAAVMLTSTQGGLL